MSDLGVDLTHWVLELIDALQYPIDALQYPTPTLTLQPGHHALTRPPPRQAVDLMSADLESQIISKESGLASRRLSSSYSNPASRQASLDYSASLGSRHVSVDYSMLSEEDSVQRLSWTKGER